MIVEEMLDKLEKDQNQIWDFIYPNRPSTKEERIALLREIRRDKRVTQEHPFLDNK